MFSIPGWPSKKIFPRATGILEFTPACPSPGLTISICYLCLKSKPTAWPLLCLQNIFTDFYSYKKKKCSSCLHIHRKRRALALTQNWILAGGVLSVAGSRERVYLFVP